jgi:hypothetical protein
MIDSLSEGYVLCFNATVRVDNGLVEVGDLLDQ